MNNCDTYVRFSSHRDKEFVAFINFVSKIEPICELRMFSYLTLINDESIDASVKNMLILYFKYRPKTEIKLSSCDIISIVTRIKRFLCAYNIAHHNMMMLILETLGKYNGVVAIERRVIHNICEQCCLPHRKDSC
ncbi:hypothetical protein RF11_01889 [Thelohanellus kitauei]|uniref:Uncharacterized protein n=1 Tax=Thelohanellus kitauei TaxID=669202 RepID=A0A0C2MC89_THEKT|nr:hypothetical protein RF11_01889 [Thelohanellus kitauei]